MCTSFMLSFFRRIIAFLGPLFRRNSIPKTKGDGPPRGAADLEMRWDTDASSDNRLAPDSEGIGNYRRHDQNMIDGRLSPSRGNRDVQIADGEVKKQSLRTTEPHGAKLISQDGEKRDPGPGEGRGLEGSLSINNRGPYLEGPDRAGLLDTDSIRTDVEEHFSSETAKRFFLQKDDEYSESELVKSCRTLNTRMNNLSGYLMKDIKEYQMCDTKSSHDSKRSNNGDRDDGEDSIMQKALGTLLYLELTHCDGKTRSISDVRSSIHDGLDAWSVFCMHLAIKPIFFGLRWRSDEETDEVIRRILQEEPELAEDWRRVKQGKFSKDLSPQVESLVKDIKLLTKSSPGDASKNIDLENTYSSLVASGNELQIALHWSALLFQHEYDQPSYKEAISETVDTYCRGIYRIFELAGVEPPDLSKTHLETIDKVVEAAAALARQTKTGVFSERIETVLIEPGSKFDAKSMRPADKAESGEVKCSLQLGLQAVDAQGKVKLLVMPEVLLV